MGALRRAGTWLGLAEAEDWDNTTGEDWQDAADDEPPARSRRNRTVAADRFTNDRLGDRLGDRYAAEDDEDDPDSGYRIATIHPTSFHDARAIGERFRDGVPVIVDLTGMQEPDAFRVVDFCSGLIFGLRGGMDRIANRVFLLLPADVRLAQD